MRILSAHLLSLLLMLCVQIAAAQSTFTSRIVDDETGEPLPLVSVYISEDKGTLTNFDGEFSIIADSTDLLRITCVGRESINLRAGELPAVLQMKMLASSLSEVTVKAVEGMLLQVARKTEKAFGRKKYKEAQYFYRQTSIISQKQDIVEAFISARSAVNLRELTFLTGRHGKYSKAAWEQSPINFMNLHHLLELGPMTKEASFWHNLITPLRPSDRWGSAIDYLQHYYQITIDEMDGDDQQLYRIRLLRNEETEVKQPIMTGTLYVDRSSLNVLAFDGQVENLKLIFGKGQLRSATTVTVTFDVHIDYRYDNKYPEVADLSMQARWNDFQTRTMLFNVEGQKLLKGKKGTHARENMLGSIAKVGYDSTFWANNEVIKRTAVEEAIAIGTVVRQQARLDSVAAVQAKMPPLQRLADRLTRFGKAIPQEKVYIHMDNTSYFLGDTIWFAAYTRRTDTDTPSRISRVLYAELWNHDGYLVERKLVEMMEGRGHGFFALPDTLYSGYFELRAYTRWQLNWGQTEHYHVKNTEYWFYNKAMAKDFFRDYEKLYSRVFPVYDKPKEAGDFYRDMTLRPLRRYFKSEPKPAELRLSLFPEGGNLVAGVPCRVAFEAATSEGEVREGEVRLMHDKETIATAYTENRGRGTFTFTPEAGQSYKTIFTPRPTPSRQGGESWRNDSLLQAGGLPSQKGGVKDKSAQSVSQIIKSIQADGVALQVHLDSLTGKWQFNVAAAGAVAAQPLGLTVMHEGQVEHFEELPHPTSHIAIPNEKLRPGVNQVTVYDSIGHVYADRLFFVTRPDFARPTLAVRGLKEQYKPFEEVKLEVKIPNRPTSDPSRQGEEGLRGDTLSQAGGLGDEAVGAGTSLSLSVRDATLSDNTFDSGNIMTEMLLASEIKGFVPQPEYFFQADDEEHRRALDLLMLTQGWRRFNWQDMAIPDTWDLTHPAEHTQMVTGTVNRYYASLEGFDPNLDIVMSEHASFMERIDPPLSDEGRYSDPMNVGAGGSNPQENSMEWGYDRYGDSPYGYSHSIGNRSYGWNLNPTNPLDVNDMQSFQSVSHLAPFQPQLSEWRNNDYNVLSYRTANSYRANQRQHLSRIGKRYLEEGSILKDVRIHAEFINIEDVKDHIIGEAETKKGRFQIDLPRFTGQCIFFLGASDTTQWKKNKPHNWVKVDPTDEYSSKPEFPEFYVRLNLPYPRWVKPYTYYQVHNAELPASDYRPLGARLTTDGSSLLNEVTIRARHGGLRHIDYTKPAYVLDACEALNLAMDAGLIDYTFSAYEIGTKTAMSLIGDMGMERRYSISTSFDKNYGRYYGYLDQRRHDLLTYTDKFYIYTDYSPRREGDERFEQDNQPSVRVDLRPYADGSQRVTYRDRRYILNGFAYQEDFYHPDYQRTPPTEATRNYRRTLYWNPELQLDANGQAHVRFFTGTRPATLSIEAAGQTQEGTLLHIR